MYGVSAPAKDRGELADTAKRQYTIKQAGKPGTSQFALSESPATEACYLLIRYLAYQVTVNYVINEWLATGNTTLSL
jgi:hypothetical protein